MKTLTIYEAFDGTKYYDKDECLNYEKAHRKDMIVIRAAEFNHYKDFILPRAFGKYMIFKKNLKTWKQYKTEYISVSEAKILYWNDRNRAFSQLKDAIAKYKSLRDNFNIMMRQSKDRKSKGEN